MKLFQSLFIYFERERENIHVHGRGAEREGERERERIPTRLPIASMKPNMELKLMNHEIMT